MARSGPVLLTGLGRVHPLAGLELVVSVLDGHGNFLAHAEVVALPIADGLVHDPDGVGIGHGALGLGTARQVGAVLAPDSDSSRRDGDRGFHGLLGRSPARPASTALGLFAGPIRNVGRRGGENLNLLSEETH